METLLDELDRTRERLLVAIEPLPDEALLAPGAVGDWSLADLLVQLTAWESELVTGLMKIERGQKPGRLLAALANEEQFSRKRFEENRGRDLDRVFDDLQQVRLQLEDWLEQFSERQLTDKKRYKWLNGRSLQQLIAQLTYEKERHYLPAVEAFARAWLEQNQAQVIPLTAVAAEDDDHDDNHQPD